MTRKKEQKEGDSGPLMWVCRETIGQQADGMTYEQEPEYVRENAEHSRAEGTETGPAGEAA